MTRITPKACHAVARPSDGGHQWGIQEVVKLDRDLLALEPDLVGRGGEHIQLCPLYIHLHKIDVAQGELLQERRQRKHIDLVPMTSVSVGVSQGACIGVPVGIKSDLAVSGTNGT